MPTFWAQLVEYLARHPQPDALKGVRLCVSSGDSLPAGVAVAFAERVGVPLIEGLGCSECSNVVISTRPGRAEPGWLGRVVPGVEVRLRDPEGRDVPDGTPGRLWIRSPSNTSGYWRRAAATRELVFGEWIRMGDMLVADAGRYRHVGRMDDLFKVDARWVSPREVESCLLDHPVVRDAAVGGVADGTGLLRVVAWVVAERPGPGRPRGRAAPPCRPSAGAVHGPARWSSCERLPRLPSGKLDRKALRESRPSRRASQSISSAFTASGASCCTQWLTPASRSTRTGPPTFATERSSRRQPEDRRRPRPRSPSSAS